MISCMQIKVLLMAVKDFNPDCGDSAYTMGIVDLLLECVELSYRPGTLFFINLSIRKLLVILGTTSFAALFYCFNSDSLFTVL